MRPQVGQLINNKYRLVRLLGDGGMGSVFEAQHEVLGNTVALKFLHPELARRQGLVQRFLQEARVSAKIQSPHVVRVTDVEQTPTGLPFMVMEFLKGKSLQVLYEENYRAGKRLSYEDALNYAMQILDGLEAAHEEGVVHRDLKPDNVMIVTGKRGEPLVKLLDFGIAKLKINGELYKGLTRPGVIMGTPEYMAPEQVFSADAVDGRADIFSCGVMFFEMLAGRRPVGGDEAHQIAAAYLSGGIARLVDLAPHVPRPLADVVHRSMAADPRERYQNVAEFRSQVEPFAREVHLKVSPTNTPPPVTPTAAGRHQEGPGPVPARAAPSPEGSSLDGLAVGQAVVADRRSIDGGATERMSEPWRGDSANGKHEANGASSLSSASMRGGTVRVSAVPGSNPVSSNQNGGFDNTVQGAPFFPGASEAYQPVDAAVAGAQRPGGTDVGAGSLPETAAFDPAQQAPVATPGYHPTPAYQAVAAAPPRRRKKGIGIGGILFIGVAGAAAVVGGVWAYDQYGGSSSKDDDKTVALPSKTGTATSTATARSSQTAPPPTTATNTTTTTNTVATQPRPTGTGVGPRPNPSGTHTPSATVTTPTSPLPFPFPTVTNLPLPIPLPGQPTPQPQPTTTSTGGDGRPKLEPIPAGILDQQPMRPQPTIEPKAAPANDPPAKAAELPPAQSPKRTAQRPTIVESKKKTEATALISAKGERPIRVGNRVGTARG
ncbi:MAG: protein kinase [Polyangiaceae bacterium]